jgi:quercetin dioxygenase-like cupin family protein
MRKVPALIGAVVALGIIGANNATLTQDKPTVKRTELQRVALDELGNREGVMYIADFPPGGVAPRHYHPGPEFIYILEGAIVLQPDGMEPHTLKQGETMFNPSKRVHIATNPSASAPAKLLIHLVAEKGQPLAVLVD